MLQIFKGIFVIHSAKLKLNKDASDLEMVDLPLYIIHTAQFQSSCSKDLSFHDIEDWLLNLSLT